MLDAEAVTHSAKVTSKPAQSTGRLAGWLHGAWETRKSPAREGAPALRHRQTHECNSTVAFLRALAAEKGGGNAAHTETLPQKRLHRAELTRPRSGAPALEGNGSGALNCRDFITKPGGCGVI